MFFWSWIDNYHRINYYFKKILKSFISSFWDKVFLNIYWYHLETTTLHWIFWIILLYFFIHFLFSVKIKITFFKIHKHNFLILFSANRSLCFLTFMRSDLNLIDNLLFIFLILYILLNIFNFFINFFLLFTKLLINRFFSTILFF